MIKTLIASVALLVAGFTQAAPNPTLEVADLVDKEGPAVVNISTTTVIQHGAQGMPMPEDQDMYDFFRKFFPPGINPRQRGPREVPARASGSGFIVSSDGYILTNAHVVDGADDVVVKLIDKRKFTAKVIGFDSRTDVALIKINATHLPTVTIGDPNRLRVGEPVAAIGSPFGFENSVTSGIVSAKGRSLPDENYVPFIQTDAAINPGNSGGPLFNMRAEVVGINSQIYSRSGGYQGVSFAIPIDVAMDVAEQLKAGGKVSRGWLGVAIQEVTSDLAESFGLSRPAGALISDVQDDSPAERSGLRVSDVILRFNGKPVENSGDLPRLVGAVKPGSKVPVQVWRKGALKELTVAVGTMPEDDNGGSALKKSGKGVSRGGLALSELSAEQRRALKLSNGLLVEDVTGDAVRAGIREGDVILAVNNTSVKTVDEFRRLIQAVPKGKSAAILVRRGDGTLYIPLKISSDE
ncbi:MAG TPA: DegQ family serine endoprotease [Thiobacillaceae bacterium]|nr:DegQ family serine endoprotease [Thiobacillaceae bacterium]